MSVLTRLFARAPQAHALISATALQNCPDLQTEASMMTGALCILLKAAFTLSEG